MKKKILIVAAVLSSSLAQAQTKNNKVADSVKTLSEITFTAGKFSQKQIETGKVVTVITREQLERSGSKTIPEILNTVAGVTVIGANNNAGTNQALSIRGSSAGNVLVLIDGIPVNDPSVITNYFDLNFLSLNQAERIEILKGGQSTLYGSDAVAGVVNIITKKAVSAKVSLNAGLEAGSYNTFRQYIDLGARKKWGDYALQYAHANSTGFSSAYDSSGKKSFDKDGFNQHNVNGNLGIRTGQKSSLRLTAAYSYYKTGLDAGAYSDEKDYTSTNNNAQLGVSFLSKHRFGSFRASYHFNYAERKYLDDSAYKGSPYLDYARSRYTGRTHFAELYDNFKWGNWELLLGMDMRYNNTYQYALFVYPGYPAPATELEAHMNQTSPYASLVYRSKKGLTIEAGSRLNIHSEYGSNLTYSFNPSYIIRNRIKVFANLYGAYKTPTLYQLFDPTYGNINLQPERGDIQEAGAELLSLKGFTARVVGFYRNTSNKIEFITTDPLNYISQYRNVSRQRNYGAELEAAWKSDAWDVHANYTYTNGNTKSGYDGTGAPLGKDTTYYNLYRIPKHAVNVSVGVRAAKNLYVSAALRTVGKRSEFVYGSLPQTLDAYHTVDLHADYRYGKWKLFTDLRNITNQRYFDIPGYNSRRFNWMLGLSMSL